MKRKFTFLMTALLLLTGMSLWGQTNYSTTYTSNVTLSTTGGTSASTCKVVVNNTQYDGIKAGTSSVAGAWKVTIPAGTQYLHLHVAAWKNDNVTLTVTPSGLVSDITLTNNSGITSNSPFTFNGDPSTSDYYKVLSFSNLTQETELTFTASAGKRFVVFGVNSETGGSTTQTVATPTFSPAGGTYSETQYVAIECATQGASIYYTTDGSTPTPNSTPFTEAITISETTTLKAIAVKQGMNNSSVATATYTFPEVYTTIPALFNAATSSNQSVLVTFGNWVVSGVSTNGKNIFVTDNDDHGLVIYYSSDMSSTFAAGDVLTGTAVACQLKLYNGFAELLNVNANDLTITEGGTVTTSNIAMSNLSGVNTGVLVHYDNLTCSVNNSKYYLSDSTTTLQVYNSLYAFEALEDGKSYNITGVYQQYNNTKEILPRSAADIVEVTAPTQTVATPTFTPEGGTYNETQYVAIECATQGADIYYTTDGTTPTPNSTMFTEAITISQTTTLKAIAVMQGMNDSEVATAEYVINIVPPAQETAYTLITNANALISGDKYIIVGIKGEAYKALGKQASNNRPSVDVTPSNDTITVTPANQSGQDAVYELTLGQENGNWTLYSAADSGYLYAASSSSNYLRTQAVNDANGQWTIEIASDGKATIKAQGTNTRNWLRLNNNGTPFACYGSGQLDVYLFKAGDVPAPPTPTYYSVGVNFNDGGAISVEPEQALENDTIRVTVAPLPGYSLTSLTYSYTGANPIDILSTRWFLMPASDVTVNAVFSEVPHVATPTFTPAEGSYNSAQTVTIACATEGATIYYTMDGTDPYVAPTGINGTQYSQAIVIGETTTLKAIAVKDGMMNSDIATATYTIEIPSMVFNKLYYHSDVTDEGIYMIVDVNGGYALTSAKGTSASPTADSILIENNAIVGNIAETLQWRIKAVEGGYQISPINDSTAYLYTTNSNSGVRVGSSTNNVWELGITDAGKPNYRGFKNVAFNRYLGVYNNQDWRTYTSINNNIANTQIEIFVLGPAPVHTFYPVNVAAVTNGTITVSDSVAEAGTVITVTAEPVAGYELATLTYSVTGANPVAIDQTTMQFTMPAAAVTVSATFTELAHVANPTFNPAAGSFITAQTVSIACATEGATIYYTTDGSDPTPNSLVFSEAFEVSETTTVKAIAVKDGMNNSDVTSATYTIIEPMSIAEARTLANNEYALVQGVVTFIDGRNVYIQDESAGIDLFLNSNTVPEALAIGDMVLGYGKKTVYNGLTELSSINGGNANQFVILSSGNELPLAEATIAEILADNQTGANMLQSTRVQIVDATIGTINTANNTPITQDGSTLNIYKMPVVEGLEEGDYVTVIGIVGCYNNPQLRVNSAEDVEFTHPAGITVTPASLSGFNYVYEEGPSTAKSFVITARSLTGATAILAPESYELSSFPGENFYPQSQVNINSYSGNFTYTIKVRLKAGLEIGTYEESIMICNELLDTIYMALTGSVTAAPQPTSDYVRVTELSQLGNGSKVIFAARYNENANEYYAMTAQASGKPEGVLFTSVAGTDAETLPSEITDAEDTYYWTVTTDGTNYTFTNANGDVLGYSSSTNFATGGDNINWTITEGTSEATAMVPNYTAFNVINAIVTNRAFALNSNHNYGAYHTQNMAGENYNFFVDMFTTSGTPVTPTCATPTFDPVGGTYFEEQTVTITCSTADATIYYTLDGSDPTPNSMVYSEPIEVAENTIIKAYAVKEGFNDSNIAEAEYTIILGAATIFFQDWEGEMNGWTFVSVEGNKPWTIGQYQGNHYAYGNGYNGGVNEQWCISPAFSLEQYSDVTLNFRNAMNYTGPELELFFSNDYDGENPGDANWTELEFNKSTGSFAWAESGAIEFTGFTGTECYIGFKYTSTETEAAAWEVDDILLMGYTSDPYLTVTPTSLTGFTHIIGQGPSASQTFTLTAGNISPAPGGTTGSINVSVFSPFEISLDDEDYGDEVFFEDITNLASTTIYVRMNGTEVGQYTETVNIYASSGDEATVTLTGTVTEPIQGGDWNHIGSLADLHDGDQLVIAARYDATVGDGYYAMTAGVSGKPDGVLFTSVNNDGIEMLPDEIVADIATFAWNVTVNDTIITLTNAAGDMLGYSSSTNFAGNTSTDWSISYATSGENAMVPNYTGFLITNVETNNRCIVMNANYKFGAYHTNNINNGDYNFYLDLFVQGGTATQTVATPVFSVASGTYFEEFDVEITCATEGAVIYYTTDGTDPTAASMVYEEPIHIDSDVTLKAIAMLEGYDDSNIATVTYVVMTGQAVILQQDWEGEMNGWTFVTVEGNKPWSIGTYGGNKYAYANGYNDDTDNEQWCISPAFDLTYYRDVVLTFRNAMKFTGPDMQLFFSSNYDGQNPSAATWTELDYEKSEGNYTWTESGEISLDGLQGKGNCYIAFLYTSNLDDGAAAWEVDDILILGSAYDAVEETELTDVNFWNYDNEIFVDNQTNGKVEMTVFNLLGQPVFAKTISAGSVRFSHNLAKGVYVVTLQNSKGRMAVKMIVR